MSADLLEPRPVLALPADVAEQMRRANRDVAIFGHCAITLTLPLRRYVWDGERWQEMR